MGSPQNGGRVEEFARATVGAPNQRIRPPDGAGLRSLEGHALVGLSALMSAPSSSARLEVLGTLGEGGMGIVRLGRQIARDCEVGVQGLTDARRGDQEAVVKLLQEAWVAGSFEHPNIVPVYDIELSVRGRRNLPGSRRGARLVRARVGVERPGEPASDRSGDHDVERPDRARGSDYPARCAAPDPRGIPILRSVSPPR